MSEGTGTYSRIQQDASSSSVVYLNVADRLRLMSAGTKSPEARQQLEQIADTYEKLASLCANFKNLKPKISITGPVLPD